MPLSQHSGNLGHKAAAHLLRRATCGARKTDIDTFASLTAANAITTLFQSTPEPLPPVDPGASISWATSTPIMGEDDLDRNNYIRSWWLGQMLGTNVAPAQRLAFSTRERLCYFLHTHFTTIQEVVNNSRSLYFQNVLFRKFAFDAAAPANVNLLTLTRNLCIDNAMLALLDGRLNVKGNPNENFSRELFELYTIGKGLAGQIPSTGIQGDYFYFTEQDIQSAALVLSGFDVDNTFSTIDADTTLPRGKAKLNASLISNQHDNTVKQFSPRLGNALITPNPALLNGGNPTEASMLDEINQLITLIFSQSETAKNLCRKIYRFFVYHDITVTIDTTIINGMAATLVANNYKLEPVVRELLGSQHFYDSMDALVENDQYGALIKSPLDLVCGTLNFFEYQMPNYITQTTDFYTKIETLLQSMSFQGMNFMNPYDVAGYEAYHQYPLFNRHWINTNALTQRYKFIYDTMTTENMSASAISIDLLTFYELHFAGTALTPDLLVREVASYLFPMYTETTELTTPRLEWFEFQFLKLGDVLNQAQPAFWQFSWTNRNIITASGMDARGMLQDKVNAMLQSPEYQLF